MLTIVTASHKNLAGLRRLADDLAPVLCERIRWRVKDSGICAETAGWAAQMQGLYVVVDVTPDAGIYDALNKAIAYVTTDYYLVVGSDDRVHAGSLRKLVELLAADPSQRSDILTFPVDTQRGLRRRKRFRPRWVSSSSLTSSHSVGTLIRRELHDRLGEYDTRFRILADALFLRRAFMSGATFNHNSTPVLGEFGLDGISSSDHGRRLVETYSYMVSTGSPIWLQALLLSARILRYQTAILL